MTGQIFALGSVSVSAWMPEFLQPIERQTSIIVPRDYDELSVEVQRSPTAEVILLSDHATLTRDLEWAETLSDRGRIVRCQSAAAATAARDKVALKQVLAARGIPTLPWRSADSPYGGGWPTPAVVKRRNGTQSEGIRLALPEERLAKGEFAEPYRDGIEYSINAFSHRGGLAVLPVVWKGRTSQQLVPPWMRPRLCGPGTADPTVTAQLIDLTAKIAAVLHPDGFFEVEFLLADDGEPYVLEVNPRVSGTLRISALAAGRPVFAWYADPPAQLHQPASACAAEVPNPSPQHITVPELGLYATSRVTVAAADPAPLAERIVQISQAGLLPEQAVAALSDACAQLEARTALPVPQ